MTKFKPMTEPEWLNSADSQRMLHFLWGEQRGARGAIVPLRVRGLPSTIKTTERKLRLFTCACCRAIWPLLTDERSRRAVETAERFADGIATEEELRQADRLADDAWNELWGTRGKAAAQMAWYVSAPYSLARNAVWGFDSAIVGPLSAVLLRDVFGNPFRPGPPRKKQAARLWNTKLESWLAWNDSTVGRIAQAVYDERGFDRMPILADALEDAGCSDPDILDHCRQPGEHVRGCWVVDLLLGKE
jgi:hypothetical protein